jgi:hypothetical protein
MIILVTSKMVYFTVDVLCVSFQILRYVLSWDERSRSPECL